MATDFSDMYKSSGGETTAANLSFSAYANGMPATRDIAPFLGRVSAPVAKTQDDVVNRMVEEGSHLGAPELTRAINAMGFTLIDSMKRDPASHNLGFARFYPAMSGGLDTADAEFDPSRNRIYIAAVPCDEIREAVEGIPVSKGQNGTNPVIKKVTWGNGSALNVIKSGEDFTIYGSRLTLNVGDESAELVLPNGSSVPIQLDPQIGEDDAHQRVTGHLAQAVSACGGAKILLRTHGLDPMSSLKPIPSPILTVLAGETPPAPTGPELTGVHAPGIESPMIHENSGTWFDGTGLDGWTGGENDEILAKNNRAEEAEWTRVDLHEDVGGEVVFDGGMLKMDEGVWTILDNLGIVEGSEVRFKVTVAGQSAEIVATVAEA